ncbi:MAG TPA: adenosylcobinamide-GDP ribazoletransferase [Acidimicrobiales bacterium]|nr:adenosylcobinamide-GDP ribazoletransferase [Acidimicrobiales bacterium]
MPTLRGLRQALGFLTPIGGAATPTSEALPAFPVVGAGVGLAVGAVWWGAGQLWPAPVAAALALVADLALTGLLHVDGLADAADGLLPHLSRERRLEVMKTPDVGAFGVAVVGATLLTRFAELDSLHPSLHSAALVAALWCVARTAMAATVDRVPYARPAGGLATAFRGRPLPWWVAAVAVAAALAGAGWWSAPAGPVAVVAGGLAFAGVVAFAVRRVGGYTGDVLGAAGVVAETVGLVVAAARWH